MAHLPETAGRPGELKGPDKQAMRFPLDMTSDELAELCGPGVYRVYALDEVGKQLAHVSTWDLTPGAREQRNATPESPLAAVRPSSAPAPMTDLRFALEAMTQMMRTHTDAFRMVAASQVDLAKTIAASKGFPRNALLAPVPPPEDESDDDDDDDDAGDQPRHWVELLMPLAQKAADLAPAFVMGKVAPAGAAGPTNAPVPANDGAETDEELASRPNWEFRDLTDFRYAHRKANAKRAVRERAASSNAAMAALQARIVADPALVQHLLAIKAQLAPDDVEVLMSAIAGSPEDECTRVLEQLKALPVEAAAACCREIVVAIREQRSAAAG